MNPFEAIEKLITEHGSAAILSHQLAFVKDQYLALERQVGEFQAKVAMLEAKLEIEHSNHKETQQELQRLKDEYSEEVRVHTGMEFRRGKRTGNEWVVFCPVCHAPADLSSGIVMCANPKCKWHVLIAANSLPNIVSKL